MTMHPDEQFLIHNLTAIASGQTKGRFAMGGHFARVMLRLYEAPPLHVEFPATTMFAAAMDKFMLWDGKPEFCSTLWRILNRSAADEFGMSVGKRAALGLFALFDKDIRDYATKGAMS